LLTASALAAAPAPLPQTLRETGLYADWESKRVADGNLPYSPQYPLWTDGAAKRRWIHLPAGKFIDARKPDAWEFPVGTKLWKEFSFGRRVETRYIERRASGWVYASYLWSEDGREAVLAPAAGVPGAAEVGEGVAHAIPSRADCLTCHEGRPSPVLGFSALQLSPSRDPGALHAEAPEPGSVDLASLVGRGVLRRFPAALLSEPPEIHARSPVERAALGYLHGNCGMCHNAAGPLASVGLDLWHDAGPRESEPGVASTVGRPSAFQVPGLRPEASARVQPGAPAASALLFRMQSRHTLTQMPPLGTRVVDHEAVQTIQRWIEELGATGPHPQSSTNTQHRSAP